MRYDITTDYGDLLVLSLHGRVLLVSRDMSEIAAKISENYELHMNRAKKTIEKANITTNKLTVEERPPYKQINRTYLTDLPIDGETSSNKKPNDGSLGKLFEL